jgi:hypothetical protein
VDAVLDVVNGKDTVARSAGVIRRAEVFFRRFAPPTQNG